MYNLLILKKDGRNSFPKVSRDVEAPQNHRA